MEAAKVDVRYVQVRCCGKTAPCPTCGKRGRRKQILPPRGVRTIAYKQVVYLEITAAEYYARCGCCKTFRSHPEGVEPRCHYDNRVRQAVLARIVEDGMSVQSLLKGMKRDFLLDLSEGFVYDCLHRQVEQLDMAEHRQWTLEHFSGTLCVDELHLGRYLPELRTLRSFVRRTHSLLELDQSEHQAWCRRAALVATTTFQAVPELAKALAMLERTKFAKMVAFLKSPVAKRLRTNNHVERANRKLRYFEKVRYKWRRRRTIVRFVLLAINHWWCEHPLHAEQRVAASSAHHRRKSKAKKRSQPAKQCCEAAYRLSG